MNGSSLLPDQRGRLHRAQAHIESALDEPLRLRSLARQAAFSPFHFHRLFARLTGEGVHAHVQRLRLERVPGLDDRVIGEFRHDGDLQAGDSYTRNEHIQLAAATS